MTDELAGLREKIEALDRAVLDALNQRLELVQQVRAHKQETGTRMIDAEREAELLERARRRQTAGRSAKAPSARSSPPCST